MFDAAAPVVHLGTDDLTDDRFAEWMRQQLTAAAERLGLSVTGPAKCGQAYRSISADAEGPGGSCWLRVGTEDARWTDDPMWTGIASSAAITGVPMPRPLAAAAWTSDRWAAVEGHPRGLRADVVTRLEGRPCSPTEVLRQDLELPDDWWSDLVAALQNLRGTPTTRFARGSGPDHAIADVFGAEIADRHPITRWETTHGDLHWNNLFGPRVGILDWEMWGKGPAGTDAATLLCCALLTPRTAQRVRDAFADVLDTEAGRAAQLFVAARLIQRHRFHPDLVGPLQAHVRDMLRQPATSR
ncbi:phosphotransferase [Amycolatopsis rubida]|uniref:phosphotransferase n=1 Tax=Amycolatopsis rubida TaxID=112413 RepID=UPI00142F3A45|nr:phosphotransferase [Amycolatopsis rubida]